MSTKDSPERAPARLDGPPPRILIIQAPYYAEVVGGMRRGAEGVLSAIGGTVETVDVAGAFELPGRCAWRSPPARPGTGSCCSAAWCGGRRTTTTSSARRSAPA
jgi:6,7-dimethyl-8-ribityllumazine synthase